MPDQDARVDLAVAAYRLRAELRSGWRFIVLSALLVGVAAGAALIALAGARRTATVFDRLSRATAAPDISVLPESTAATVAITEAEIAALPGVRRVSGAAGFFLARADGGAIDSTVLAPTGSGFLSTMERPIVREGRLPDQRAPYEIFANAATAAQLGLRVGDTIDFLTFRQIDYHNVDQYMDKAPSLDELRKMGTLGHFRLVGIGMTVEEAADPTRGNLYFTQAFRDRVRPGVMYTGFDVDLVQGTAGIPAFESLVAKLAPGEPVSFSTISAVNSSVSRVLGPEVAALQAFGAVMAIAAAAIWALAAVRRARMSVSDDRDYIALGMRPSALLYLDLMRTLLIAALATAIALSAAYVGSALMPVTEAWRIEPTRGMQFDGRVLGVGAVVLFAVIVIVGLLVSPRLIDLRASSGATSRVNSFVRQSLDAPTVTTGVANALEVGGGPPAASTRSALVGTTVGLALIVAVLTFAFNFNGLIRTPSSFGWGYDVALEVHDASTDQAAADGKVLDTTLAADPRVRGWGYGGVTQAVVENEPTAIMAIEQLGGKPVHPTVVAGRAPESGDEVALGTRTARAVGASIGSTVHLGREGTERTFSVVGIVILPGLTSNALDAAALGGGALVTTDGLQAALGTQLDLSTAKVVVDLQPGASASDFARDLHSVAAAHGFGDNLSIAGPGLPAVPDNPVEPTEIVALRAVQSTPMVLAILLTVLAAAAVAHALIGSVRRRSRTFGTLQALGFTPRQVRLTIAWQATTIAAVATLIGVPLGIIGGRQAWRAIADRIGVVDHPIMPWTLILLALPLTVIITNLVAALPGRAAARQAPAQALRDE